MTACVNKKHSRRVAAAVSASLVGALTLGAAPVLAVAEEAPVEAQWAESTGAFAGRDLTAEFSHGKWTKKYNSSTQKVCELNYIENVPVALNSVTIDLIGTTDTGDLKIDPADENDDYDVAYYQRNEDGKPEGDAIKTDISAVGNYVAVVSAKADTTYEGSVAYIPFDIVAKTITNVTIDGDTEAIYNGEKHQLKLKFDGTPVTEGIDYTVEYVYTGHDATPDNVKDIVEAGDYVAKVTGLNKWAGTVTLSENFTVKPLDLSTAGDPGDEVFVEGAVSAADKEPSNTFAIWIEGVCYSGDDPIIAELKADLADDKDVWFENGAYTYTLKAADANDTNIVNDTTFSAYKVGRELSFLYDGEAMPASPTVFVNDAKTHWDSTKVTGFAKDGTEDGKTVAAGDVKEVIYGPDGNVVTEAYMNANPGVYTACYWVSNYENNAFGGQTYVTIHVYQDAIDADASAVVLFDEDNDGRKEYVSSVSTTYKPGRNLIGEISVAVEDGDGNDLSQAAGDYEVTYYNADGIAVNKVEDAGTYTLKVTSSKYLISGTTEMTITVGKLDLSTVRSGKVTSEPFDKVGSSVEYLPWRELSYTIGGTSGKSWGLGLEYLIAGGDAEKDSDWAALPMDIVKVTITKDGKEVERIADEGVYVIKFEARNDDADNNYTVPGDLTITCIKDGTDDAANHLKYSDVRYTDYFADPVDWISNPARAFMTGYKDTRVFGSLDQLTRGQVACVLFNMASLNHHVDESSLKYNELFGYDSGFSDVNGKAYYAKAIAWAAQAGVVNGYQDGTFHADQAVTRQEFACMLANYAKAYGTYEAAGSDALDEMSDADQVAEFATDSVAWAVENGIIGNSGYVAAGSTIIRADAACMVYNYAK